MDNRNIHGIQSKNEWRTGAEHVCVCEREHAHKRKEIQSYQSHELECNYMKFVNCGYIECLTECEVSHFCRVYSA